MRFHSALILGLSFLTALNAAESPASNSDTVVVDKRDVSDGLFHHARDAVVGSLHEVEARSLHGRSPKKSSKKAATTPAKEITAKETTVKQTSITTQPKTSVTPTSTSVKTTSSVSKTSSQRTSSTVLNTSHRSASTGSSSGKTSSSTLSTIATATGTATGTNTQITSTDTQTSTSATASSTIQARVRCGSKGSTCSGTSCSLTRDVDLRQAINRRAYAVENGALANLQGRKTNTKLSDSALRDAWIPFGTEPASVTISRLTGCTAVIAISQKGMYAFHIWEDGEGDVLSPARYKTTLANVQAKLASKKEELAGGELYLYMPTNPDQAGQLLYDSTHWNDDLTEEESEPVPAGDPKWTKQVPRVAAIRSAITTGSGLAITKEALYRAPKKGDKKANWITAQFDPTLSDTQKQFGVWTNVGGKIGQTEFEVAAVGSSS